MDVVKDSSGKWIGYIDPISLGRAGTGRWTGRIVQETVWRALPFGEQPITSHKTKRAAIETVYAAHERMSKDSDDE